MMKPLSEQEQKFLKGDLQMANINDIAKIAGVSVTTVSRVLNNHPYVSFEKRKQF